MKAKSQSDVRKTFAETLDSVSDDHEPLIITRSGGKPPVVLISLEDFGSYEETEYLLGNPYNAKRLITAIENIEAGKGKKRELID